MSRILCPAQSGVLAALGLLVSDRRRDVQRTVLLSGPCLRASAVAGVARELAATARRALGEPGARVEASYEMRYRGQSFELAIAGPLEPSPKELRTGFEQAHQERFGFHDPEQAVELVTVRVTAVAEGTDVRLAEATPASDAQTVSRPVWADGEEVDTCVLRGALAPGTPIEGPAVVELPEATMFVSSAWSGAVDSAGTVVLERRR